MADIEITRAHNRSHDEARKLAESVAAKLGKSFDMTYHWEGDKLHFERSGVKGQLDVQPKDVVVTAKLGLMLKPLKGKITEEVEKALDKALA